MVETFYFNTGVRPESGSPLFGRQIWKDGTKQIPFTCDNVPDNSIFLFACDSENHHRLKSPCIIVRRIIDNGPKGLLSKFAYFRVKEEKS